MKALPSFLPFMLALMISSAASSQTVVVNTEKDQYKINEVIIVEFKVDSEIDSVGKIVAGNFQILNGPTKTQTKNIVNGVTSHEFKLRYEILGIQPGIIQIVSPNFYKDGVVYRADNLSLTILNQKFKSQESDDAEFREFKRRFIKPDGTIRVIISEQFGYVEEFKNSEWVFKRRLTNKEISKWRKL